MENSETKGAMLILITACMFAAGAILAKVLVALFSVFMIAFIAIFSGFVLLCIFLQIKRKPIVGHVRLVHSRDLVLSSVFGMAGPLSLILFGLKLTTAFKAGFLLQLQFASAVLLSLILLHERISKKQVGALSLLFSGSLLLVNCGQDTGYPSTDGLNLGDLCVTVGAFGLGYGLVLSKRLSQQLDPSQIAALRLLVGAGILAPLLATPTTLSVTAPISLWIMTLFALYVLTNFFFGFLTLHEGLRLLPAWKTAAIMQTMPIFSTMFAVAILGEAFVAGQALGGALIVIGGLLLAH